jgi:hypothetical protein
VKSDTIEEQTALLPSLRIAKKKTNPSAYGRCRHFETEIFCAKFTYFYKIYIFIKSKRDLCNRSWRPIGL